MKNQFQKYVQFCLDEGATFADFRFVEWEEEHIDVHNGYLEDLSHRTDAGVGVRVLLNGCWGFAATAFLDEKSILNICKEALKLAEASSSLSHSHIEWTQERSHQGFFKTAFEKDPFKVALHEKVEHLKEVHSKMIKNSKIKLTDSYMIFSKTNKIYINSENTSIETSWVQSGGQISATAVGQNDAQRRTLPENYRKKGYEWIEEMKFLESAERVSEEAISLLGAQMCPTKKTNIILDPHQMALQVHESIGHPLELDRIFGSEAGYAGRSFVKPEMIGNFIYGSSLVNVTLDSTLPGELGTVGYDDDGVKAQVVPLIKKGILVNALTSREYASKIHKESNATNIASSWNRMPIIRMTGIHLEPGDQTLESLISETEEGIYMKTNKSWSIDDLRQNFQFGCEIAWEIKNGKLGHMYKNPNYQGMTPEFWGACSGIADRSHWEVRGVPNCGKGEPGQIGRVCHGAAHTKFKNVQVFGT
ncbi:MAG: TldD/PmbA family protein [Deltaproteobacteria bacterium]|nr:TldD/PmbA family protein [Deltaproteobacteria bacterium]